MQNMLPSKSWARFVPQRGLSRALLPIGQRCWRRSQNTCACSRSSITPVCAGSPNYVQPYGFSTTPHQRRVTQFHEGEAPAHLGTIWAPFFKGGAQRGQVRITFGCVLERGFPLTAGAGATWQWIPVVVRIRAAIDDTMPSVSYVGALFSAWGPRHAQQNFHQLSP